MIEQTQAVMLEVIVGTAVLVKDELCGECLLDLRANRDW